MSVVALVWTDVDDGRGGVSAGGQQQHFGRASLEQGCQIFLWLIPKRGKYTKLSNGRKYLDQISIKYVYEHLQLQNPPKFIQIGIFGLKIYHLATLVWSQSYDR
jgi:hypothetical protein